MRRLLKEITPAAPARACVLCQRPLRGDGAAHKSCLAKKAKSEDVTGPISLRLWEHYMAEYKRVRGVDVIFTMRDRIACKRAAVDLVPQIGEQRVMQLITIATERGDGLTTAVYQPNKYQGAQPRQRREQLARQARPLYEGAEADPWDLAGGADADRRH